MKTPIPRFITRCALPNFTKRIASIKSVQISICAISVMICAVCGVEGGYQLHLSHEHSALSCLKLNMPVPVDPGDQIDLMTDANVPACREPDELGQPWRLRLVLLDMLGFVVLGTIGLNKGKAMMVAGAP